MKHQSAYPRWRYHPSHEARIVKSEDEDKLLGKGWHDSPADFDRAEKVPVSKDNGSGLDVDDLVEVPEKKRRS